MKTKYIWSVLVLLIMIALLLVSYNPAAQETAAQNIEAAVQEIASPSTLVSTTPFSVNTIVVTSTADSGSGTLRQALDSAQSGASITFDPTTFPPRAPATIFLKNATLVMRQGNVTIDASNAGVILDGSRVVEDFANGLEIVSNDNTIQGLQFTNFSPGAGIRLGHGAQYNTIGGDRSIGSGPIGQGNLVNQGDLGINIYGEGTSFNTIVGNLIGTDTTGRNDCGNNGAGIGIGDGASHNIIGPNNVIAYNGQYGINMARESIDFN